jgi:adenosine deaminase
VYLEEPPGMPRLIRWATDRIRSDAEVDALDADPENFTARIEDVLDEAASDTAIYVEVRFGANTIARPDFMPRFREAERRTKLRWPRLRAEALISGLTPATLARWERVPPLSLAAARDGLAGTDLTPDPYDAEADWTGVADCTARAADAGLGVTVHAGEFSQANIAQAVALPGVSRLGHAVFAVADNRLLDAVARSGVTLECCLSCNVLLGGAASYAEHPIRQFVAPGIPVALNADDPQHVCTTIGREYAIAATMGFSLADLLALTRAAVQASFTSPTHKTRLLAELDGTDNAASTAWSRLMASPARHASSAHAGLNLRRATEMYCSTHAVYGVTCVASVRRHAAPAPASRSARTF